MSESWFYKWRNRPAQRTPREVRSAELADRIRHFFAASGDTYGSPRITLDLWAEGWQVSENTVAEITVELGLQGRTCNARRQALGLHTYLVVPPWFLRRTVSAHRHRPETVPRTHPSNRKPPTSHSPTRNARPARRSPTVR
ncbi:IS3 family transposase [Kitasatospora sp. NPDC001159]